MSDGEEAYKGLEFWFRSLATHLSSSSSSSTTEGEGVYYSVIVVGTFLDHPSVNSLEGLARVDMVNEHARECGLKVPSLQYFEVSCSASLENIDKVQEAITKTALSHSHLGERVPKSYLTVSKYLKEETKEKKAQGDIPVRGLAEVFQKYSESLVKRALGLLSLWGECVYLNHHLNWPHWSSWILPSWPRVFSLTCSTTNPPPRP